MDVRNCRMCGSLYNYIGGTYRNLCPQCIKKMEDKFEEVKKYIEDNPGASISVVSMECDVSPDQIQRWVREDRLVFADDSPIGIPCERCGTMIKSGRFCDQCKMNMTNSFSQAYEQPKEEPKKISPDKSARIRFMK
ncbi:MAG: flagellar protein [Clostridia bacterium]|nr:flagellar protein [Clostridia bacterium]